MLGHISTLAIAQKPYISKHFAKSQNLFLQISIIPFDSDSNSKNSLKLKPPYCTLQLK